MLHAPIAYFASKADKFVFPQVLKREYTYNRTVQVKNADGTETHKTMSKLPHSNSYTHMQKLC